MARMEDMRIAQRIWLRNLNGRDELLDVSVDGRIKLEWMLKKQDGEVWTGSILLRIGTSGGIL